MNEADELLDVEAAATAVDLVADRFRRGVLTSVEAMYQLIDISMGFARFSIDLDEADLVLDYARLALVRIAGRGGANDPVLLDYFDQSLVSQRQAEELNARFELYFEPIERAAQRGDQGARDSLIDLCRAGHASHRAFLRVNLAAPRILRSVYRLGIADALHGAVSPRYADQGQIAHPSSCDGHFQLAMDFLAHLAADPEGGDIARSALLDLADYIETAGEAIVRLPMHLLDNDDRRRLLEIHERRVEMFNRDSPFISPLSVDLLRDNRVVQTAVWQAFDASHFR